MISLFPELPLMHSRLGLAEGIRAFFKFPLQAKHNESISLVAAWLLDAPDAKSS
jgi:hypothetical protein